MFDLGLDLDNGFDGLSVRTSGSQESLGQDVYDTPFDFSCDQISELEDSAEEDDLSDIEVLSDDEITVKENEWREFEKRLPAMVVEKLSEMETRLTSMTDNRKKSATARQNLALLFGNVLNDMFPALVNERDDPQSLLEMNWDLADAIHGTMTHTCPSITETAAKAVWAYPILAHNQKVLDKIEKYLFDTLADNPIFNNEQIIEELMESISTWTEEANKKNTPTPTGASDRDATPAVADKDATPLPTPAVVPAGEQPPNTVGTKKRPTTGPALKSSPLEPLGKEILDWAVIFNWRKKDLKDLSLQLEDWGTFSGYSAGKISQLLKMKLLNSSVRFTKKYMEETLKCLKYKHPEVISLHERRIKKCSFPPLITSIPFLMVSGVGTEKSKKKARPATKKREKEKKEKEKTTTTEDKPNE